MRRCLRAGVAGIARRPARRPLSTVISGHRDVERVRVKCGSAGSIFVDLHHVGRVASSEPLLIYLPPFSTSSAETAPELPPFLRKYPAAVINYRWTGYQPFGDAEPAPSPSPSPSPSPEQAADGTGFSHLPTWPFPVHDTLQGYSWIVENLAPVAYTRRDVYVYGSYLGASLATSMALTETHPHQRMAVRGCVAFNGIYNWTMFLPDHQVNQRKAGAAANMLEEILGQPTDPVFDDLRRHAPALFGNDPGHLFDSFASPCLFFQTPGLLVPGAFDASADPLVTMLGSSSSPSAASSATSPPRSAETELAIRALLGMMQAKPPRRSPLAFPPRKSTLKIPETLLLHTPAPRPAVSLGGGRRRAASSARGRRGSPDSNDFGTQASELAALMRRSMEKLELRDRARWDGDFDVYDEIQQRVQLRDVGMDWAPFQLPSRGEEVALAWLQERMAVQQ